MKSEMKRHLGVFWCQPHSPKRTKTSDFVIVFLRSSQSVARSHKGKICLEQGDKEISQVRAMFPCTCQDRPSHVAGMACLVVICCDGGTNIGKLTRCKYELCQAQPGMRLVKMNLQGRQARPVRLTESCLEFSLFYCRFRPFVHRSS